MKSGVAAFVAAAVSFVHESPPKGSLIITITGDEEARAVDGTIAIFDWMETQNQKMNVCIVGEPTCPEIMGEAIKIGRRGSLSVKITMLGVQGHSAYPERYINPVEAMVHPGLSAYIHENWMKVLTTFNHQIWPCLPLRQETKLPILFLRGVRHY